MADRPIKTSGHDHPITITPNGSRVTIHVGGRMIADTTSALTLHEANYPPVHYVPRKDVDLAALATTDTRTHCPYKGEASYFSIPAGGARSVDAIWSYEDPHEGVAAIKDHLAFYPDRVETIEEHAG